MDINVTTSLTEEVIVEVCPDITLNVEIDNSETIDSFID